MNRSGSAAQSGSEMNRSGSLRTYLMRQFVTMEMGLVRIDHIRNYGPDTRDGASGFDRAAVDDGGQLQFRSRRVRSVAM